MGIAIIDNTTGIFEQSVFPTTPWSPITVYTFTFFLENTGDVTATNILFSNVINDGVTYISNSLTVNGLVLAGFNPLVPVPILDTLPRCATAIVTLQLRGEAAFCNLATVSFNYIDNCSGPCTGYGLSNLVCVI